MVIWLRVGCWRKGREVCEGLFEALQTGEDLGCLVYGAWSSGSCGKSASQRERSPFFSG